MASKHECHGLQNQSTQTVQQLRQPVRRSWPGASIPNRQEKSSGCCQGTMDFLVSRNGKDAILKPAGVRNRVKMNIENRVLLTVGKPACPGSAKPARKTQRPGPGYVQGYCANAEKTGQGKRPASRDFVGFRRGFLLRPGCQIGDEGPCRHVEAAVEVVALARRTWRNRSVWAGAICPFRYLPPSTGAAGVVGCRLPLGADFRIVEPGASLSIMEGKWGLIPDMGGTLACAS